MKMIFKIAKTELQSLFYSPVAWLILVIFTFQVGMIASALFEETVRYQAMGYTGGGKTFLFRENIHCRAKLSFSLHPFVDDGSRSRVWGRARLNCYSSPPA